MEDPIHFNELRICRRLGEEPISLDEWRVAIRSVEGVRPSDGVPLKGHNPRTGEPMTIPVLADSGEVRKGDDWFPLLSWRKGSATLFWSFDDDPSGLVPIFALADYLQAQVIDERSGEEIDREIVKG